MQIMVWKLSSLGRARRAWLRAVWSLRSSGRWDSPTTHLPSAPVETSVSHSRPSPAICDHAAHPTLPALTAPQCEGTYFVTP